VRLAELALYQQNLRAAQEYARRAVQLLPRSALARYQLGRVYLEQDRVFQAEQQFRQAVILDPQFA
jgi:tetratricopeptide (TPR) repeat protein